MPDLTTEKVIELLGLRATTVADVPSVLMLCDTMDEARRKVNGLAEIVRAEIERAEFDCLPGTEPGECRRARERLAAIGITAETVRGPVTEAELWEFIQQVATASRLQHWAWESRIEKASELLKRKERT